MKKSKKVLWSVLLLVMVFSFASVASAAPYSWGGGNFVQVRRGSNNNYVRAAQNICSYNLLSGTLVADGVFGDNTHSAVTQYQKKYGLDVDGIVGPNTWSHMQSQLSGYSASPRVVTGSFKIWQYGIGFTARNYFRRLSTYEYRWDTYRQHTPAGWYIIKY